MLSYCPGADSRKTIETWATKFDPMSITTRTRPIASRALSSIPHTDQTCCPAVSVIGYRRADFKRSRIFQSIVFGFHKRSNDGSAKCNAYFSGNPTDGVYGVVCELLLSEKAELDRAEGLGFGYNETEISVSTQDGKSLNVQTYLADPSVVDNGLRPYTWYKEFVVGGPLKISSSRHTSLT